MKNTHINALAVVVSSEEEHPELINQFLSRKARAVFRVFPAHNSAGDVVGPLILRECEARIHQGPELRADIFASSQYGVVLGDGTEGLGKDQPGKLDMGRRALENRKGERTPFAPFRTPGRWKRSCGR